MKLRWLQGARVDLVDIAQHIAADDPIAAKRWVKRLRVRANGIVRFPRAGRIAPEIGRKDIREVIVGNYRIVYRIVRNEIHILTVFEGHRLLRLQDENATAAPEEDE